MKRRTLALILTLVLTLGLTGPAGAAGSETGFSDVSDLDYFAQAVDWAVENGITQVTGGGAFSPDATVTRAEAVTFL